MEPGPRSITLSYSKKINVDACNFLKIISSYLRLFVFLEKLSAMGKCPGENQAAISLAGTKITC